MVILGLLFFLFASLTPDTKKVKKDKTKTKIPTRFNTTAVKATRVSEPQIKQTLFNFRYPEHRASTEQERRIRAERRVKASQSSYIEPLEETERTSTVTRMDMPNLQEIDTEDTLTAFQEPVSQTTFIEPEYSTRNEKIVPMNQISLRGLLFFDYAKSIPFENKQIQSLDWQEGAFSSFKRIGFVDVIHENKTFKLTSGNSSFVYDYSDIHEIVFFNEAFALIPKKTLFPTPLVFTEETQKLKETIRPSAV